MNAGRILCALLIFLLLPAAMEGRRPSRRPKRKSRTAPQLIVVPSAEIEARVAEETRIAEAVLAAPETAPDLFASPYVVSAVYYRDGFLAEFPKDRPDAHPSRRIISQISRLLRPEIRTRYIQQLRDRYRSDLADFPREVVQPVASEPSPRRRRRTHQYAIDLFVPEGSPVRSAASGVVILADRNWSLADPFSASSPQGGNAVIIFDPVDGRFFRYCHLDDVQVVPGMLIPAGRVLGTVGHTGFNAARPGHGGHLHFEMNIFENGNVRTVLQPDLIAFLRRAAPAAAEPPVDAAEMESGMLREQDR